MPRENRKRGKKHKKPKDVVEDASVQHYHEDQQAGPSWIIDPKPGHELGEGASPDAPFGYVDADVKAYFRTVDAKLREWQETDSVPDMEQGAELNEGAFLVSYTTEAAESKVMQRDGCSWLPRLLNFREKKNSSRLTRTALIFWSAWRILWMTLSSG